MTQRTTTTSLSSIWLVIVMILLNTPRLFSQKVHSDSLESHRRAQVEQIIHLIDHMFPQEMEQNQVPGGVAAIVFQDSVVHKAGYGYADIDAQRKADPDQTVFRVASLSKIITTIAVLQLVDEGKVDLDENIETYLRGVDISNPFLVKRFGPFKQV